MKQGMSNAAQAKPMQMLHSLMRMHAAKIAQEAVLITPVFTHEHLTSFLARSALTLFTVECVTMYCPCQVKGRPCTSGH